MTTVAVTNKDFSYTVKFLKKNGYTFDAATKTWVGSKSIDMLMEDGYVRVVSQQPQLVNDDLVTNIEG